MCRLVAYLGEEILIDRVLVRPENSLVMQSLHAREASQVPTNGDGFGIGWYTPSINPDPAIFTSIFPAWSDKNLLHLTSKIKSPCFFGHVRAASVGGINTYNCHPFIHGRWMLMHNGDIGDFILIKRHIRRMLDDEYYQWIQGETDSEHFFALFLQLAKDKNLNELSVAADTLLATIETIQQLINMYGAGDRSSFNICLTDGLRIIATRYSSDKRRKPESMHYIVGYGDAENPRKPQAYPTQKPTFVLVSSEQLTHWHESWQVVPPNHLLLVNEERGVELTRIN
jgi:glutamine amidotransferase